MFLLKRILVKSRGSNVSSTHRMAGEFSWVKKMNDLFPLQTGLSAVHTQLNIRSNHPPAYGRFRLRLGNLPVEGFNCRLLHN